MGQIPGIYIYFKNMTECRSPEEISRKLFRESSWRKQSLENIRTYGVVENVVILQAS